MAQMKKRGEKPASGQYVIVAGAGRSGVAAARLLQKLGTKVRLMDKNPDALSPNAVQDLEQLGMEVVLGNQDSANYDNAIMIVTSPGFPIRTLEEMYIDSPCAKPEIISETELAWRCLSDERILAVTGTSGKTTTVSLAAAMLEAQGYQVFLGGNIGTPLSEYVLDNRKAEILALEVSSFQLQGCNTFSPDVAVILNITPNHLDYHKDMSEYAEAKFNIFRFQDEQDKLVLGRNVEKYLGEIKPLANIIWLGETYSFNRCKLLGNHNKINIEAAWEASRFFDIQKDNAAKAVAEFSPLPHRLEFVGEIGGTSFINDSKCTTVASLEVALSSFNQPVRLLCGGKYKGGDLSALKNLVKEKVCEIALFGASKEIFEEAWKGLVPMHWHLDLETAMTSLNRTKKPQDIILLSPATSSFDQYANYEKRGEDFKRIFYKLQSMA